MLEAAVGVKSDAQTAGLAALLRGQDLATSHHQRKGGSNIYCEIGFWKSVGCSGRAGKLCDKYHEWWKQALYISCIRGELLLLTPVNWTVTHQNPLYLTKKSTEAKAEQNMESTGFESLSCFLVMSLLWHYFTYLTIVPYAINTYCVWKGHDATWLLQKDIEVSEFSRGPYPEASREDSVNVVGVNRDSLL